MTRRFIARGSTSYATWNRSQRPSGDPGGEGPTDSIQGRKNELSRRPHQSATQNQGTRTRGGPNGWARLGGDRGRWSGLARAGSWAGSNDFSPSCSRDTFLLFFYFLFYFLVSIFNLKIPNQIQISYFKYNCINQKSEHDMQQIHLY
jgi:hypothetical protein